MKARILASVAVELVATSLEHEKDSEHQCFRVKNLLSEEIVHFVQIWEACSSVRELARVRVVVASSLNGTISSSYVAELGKSITYYRNNNKTGLVYLETEDQSDAQGLQNFFTLRDSNFLDHSFDNVAGGYQSVARLIAAEAWKSIGFGSEPPSMMLAHIEQLIGHLHPKIEPVPVRKFIEFCYQVALAWRQYAAAVDEEVASQLIGECFWHLDLFPDGFWRDVTSDSRTHRRLELNVRYSELRSVSGDMDPAVLIDIASRKEFFDEDGDGFDAINNQTWRRLCISYIENPVQATISLIPYFIFAQLFQKDATGIQLGDRARQEIEESDRNRLAEVDALDVVAGINQKLQPDAERLLSVIAQGEMPALSDLLTTKTRKMIERVAYPKPREFDNPLVETVRHLVRFRQQFATEEIDVVRLEFAADAEKIGPAAGLFAFLYGPTLLEVSEASLAAECACKLSIDLTLTNAITPPILRTESSVNDEELEEDLRWEPVPVRWVAYGASGEILDASDVSLWSPLSISHLALFWFLMTDVDSPSISGVGGFVASEEMRLSGDQWIDPFVARVAGISSIPVASSYISVGQNILCDRLIESRNELHQDVQSNGLSISIINTYFDRWLDLLNEARETMVPNGARIAAIDALLLSDSISFGSSRRQVLPSQAFRLRWIGRYLEESRKLLIDSLYGQAGFAAQDGDVYLDWLEGRCPREMPPVTVDDNADLLFAHSEFSWFEYFSKLETGDSSFGDDPDALSAICSRVNGYLDAHPYKRDGLSLLLVLPPSDQSAAQIIDLLSSTALKGGGCISMTVAAPRCRWEGIARGVEAHGDSDNLERRIKLFPSRDLSFVEFELGMNLATSIAERTFDIGIVINVLNGGMQPQQNTEPMIPVPGYFDVLFDRTTQMVSTGDGGATSIIMRPKNPDKALDSWGTLVVRANRARPVSPAQPENTDFIELRLNFSGYAPLFNVMHQRCHWVVALERHVSRKQIESIEAGAPDVLSIQDGVGANGFGTLVVSSRSGRALIESRLIRKLRKLVPAEQLSSSDGENLARLASVIYDETRWTSPRLALNAMGISRVTEEILGLAVARAIADHLYPLPVRPGFAAWISLDEYYSWFGGPGSVRADMCRLTFSQDDSGCVILDVLVVEGKLRQSFDPHGIKQASAIRQFMIDVLGTSEGQDSRKKIDATLWRDRIFSAVDMCADQARITFNNLQSSDTEDIEMLRSHIRASFREGRYELNSANAVYSACLWESQTESIESSITDDVQVVRTSNSHILPLVQRKQLDELFGGPLKSEIKLQVEGLTSDTTLVVVSSKMGGVDNSSVQDAVPVQQIPDVITGSEKPTKRNALSEKDLQSLYGEILACFAAHGVSVSAAQKEDEPFVEGPASILFKVRPRPGVDPRKLYERADALKLNLKLDNEQSVGFGIERGYVTIDVPKSAEQRYFVDANTLWANWERPAAALVTPLGEDRFGQIVDLNFSSTNSPHLLIGGTTGSGKSEALNTILYGLVQHYSPQELRLMLIDPKGTELTDFQRFAHLEGEVGWDDADAVDLLTKAVAEMQRRYELFKENGVRSLADYNEKSEIAARIPWWVIVLDEYADLTSDPQSKKSIEFQLKRLAQKARASGIHLIIATQKPSGDVISTNLRSNLPAQLALRVKSGTESRVIMDETGAESLNGKGDAYLKSEGKLRRIQCARVDPNSVH